MEQSERQDLIRQYAQGYDLIAEALAGASDADLDRKPADGSWTARRVVHHMADSEMTSALRVRRLIAEESPQIVGYPEEVWAERVYYDDRPIAPSLEAFRAARASTVPILERMTDAEWVREGTHSELGRYTPEVWLQVYVNHAKEHAEQIRRSMRG
jgi:DinB superfamily